MSDGILIMPLIICLNAVKILYTYQIYIANLHAFPLLTAFASRLT